jgi:CheY-like chemotaxis protein
MTTTPPAILVVDDEEDTCRNLNDILTDLGYEVTVATDGAAALDLVRRQRYDVALLDLLMPGMDGLEFYRAMKRERAGTVAVIVTGHPNDPKAVEALAAGAWRVMAKPVEIPELLGLVDEVVRQPLVLVVDDDPGLCANLWDLLREQGYRVCLAHDERTAAERLAVGRFSVILLDMRLPGTDGTIVFRLARQMNPQAQVVAITGYRSDEEPRVRQLLAAGAREVIEKPFDVPRLLATLRQLVT